MSVAPPARVLVVDPDLDNCLSLELLLRVNGHEAHCLQNGRLVLAACRTWYPTALLMELRLPGLNGWEVARLVRQDASLEGLLLIAFTTCGSVQDLLRSHQAGFNFHLIKPGDPQKLLGLLACGRGGASGSDRQPRVPVPG